MKKRVKITIPSGQTFGTKIVDEETGEEISNVFNVEFRHRVNELPTLKIERYLLDEDVEITGRGRDC